MKVAICISGHLRDGDKNCFPSLKTFLLNNHDCDFFVSSWKELGYRQFCGSLEFPSEKDDITSRILETYLPKKFHLDDVNSHWINDAKNKWKNISTSNGSLLFQISCMFRKIHEADQLRCMYQVANGTSYDVVIRLRFDTELLSDIVLESMEDIKSGKIITKPGFNGFSDQLFWGQPEIMSIASKCFVYISNPISELNFGSFENPESILKAYYDSVKISPIIRNDIKFSLTKPHGRYIT